ncbi:MAG: efflux RND transporter periplasmic adaptor subunit [Spirochaetaceae bacterium]|jgi:RND family efflux transporter MFP subunit|nr:efflux RND transporter periplasmic adaptor subunit [Spirochaetaceae bacterium]
MKSSYKAFCAAVLCGAAFFTACVEKSEKTETPVSVKTTRLSDAGIENAARFSGEISAGRDIALSFLSAGKALAVNVNDGDYVSVGQTLAVIDSTDARSLFNAAKAKLDQANDAYNRYLPMHNDGNMSEIDWEKVIVSRDEAAAAFDIAKNTLDNCTLTAPVSGHVSGRHVDVGENVVPGVPVMHILSLDTLYADISIPANEIEGVKAGMDAIVRINGKAGISAKVFDVDVSADPLTRTYKARILMNGPNDGILPGMLCNVYVVGSSETGDSSIAIPASALNLGADGEYFVYVIDEAVSRARRREVKAAGFSGDSIIVTGMSGGELIVTEGAQKLDEGTLVSTR